MLRLLLHRIDEFPIAAPEKYIREWIQKIRNKSNVTFVFQDYNSSSFVVQYGKPKTLKSALYEQQEWIPRRDFEKIDEITSIIRG